MRTRRACGLVALAVAAIGGLCGRAAASGPQAVAPPASAVPGWKQVGATRMYDARNLFDLIDGEAQAVLGYAFQACAHAEYAPASQTRPALSVDVYDMTDPLNAYGLFGSDRLGGKAIALGAEGVRVGRSGVSFWKGRYVVRTALFQVNPALEQAQIAFARAAAARISGASAPPAIVRALPPGRQPGSERYVRSNVVGQAFLRNAVTARYPSIGQGAELFICTFGSASEAGSALERYRAFERTGAGLAAVAGVGDAAFHVVDRYAKNVVVARKGRFVVGVVRAKDAAGGRALVAQAVGRVR